MLMERIVGKPRRALRRFLAAMLTIHLVLLFHVCCSTVVSGEASHAPRDVESAAGGCCAGGDGTAGTDSCHNGDGPCFCAARTIPLSSLARVTVTLSPAVPIDSSVEPARFVSISEPTATIEVLAFRPPRSRPLPGPEPGRAPPDIA